MLGDVVVVLVGLFDLCWIIYGKYYCGIVVLVQQWQVCLDQLGWCGEIDVDGLCECGWVGQFEWGQFGEIGCVVQQFVQVF